LCDDDDGGPVGTIHDNGK